MKKSLRWKKKVGGGGGGGLDVLNYADCEGRAALFSICED